MMLVKKAINFEFIQIENKEYKSLKQLVAVVLYTIIF